MKSIRDLEKRNEILLTLCSDYVVVYCADFDTGEYEVYRNLDKADSVTTDFAKSELSYFDTMEHYIESVVVEEDRSYVRDRTDRKYVLHKLQEQKNYSVRYKVKENKQGIKNFEMHFADMSRKPGEHIVTVGFRNVDSIVQKEEDYRLETQHNIEETLEGARIGIWTIEYEDGCEPRMYADKTMRMLLGVEAGISPKECYQNWFERISPEYVELVEEAVQEILEKGRSEVIYPWNHPTLGVIYVRCGGVVDDKFRKAGFGLKGYHQDITETMETEKRQEKALMEALLDAKRANLAKTEFLSHMSHDIRTPINGILGMLAIGDRNDDNLEKQRECREKIATAANHLLSLINDNVLDISKLESGALAFAKEPFDIMDVVENCTGILRPQAEEQGLSMEVTCGELKHTKLIGSPLHLRQILINIMGNAIKYNRPNGKIYVNVEELDEKAVAELPHGGLPDPVVWKNTTVYRFCIKDTGIGMSEEFQKHLFQPFMQEHNDARTNYSGTGLGMAIAKNLAVQMGGGICVQSELDKGSCFAVVLPQMLDVDWKQEEPEEKPEIPADISGVRVLLVEDNALNREIVQYMLEDAGVTVVNATNGKEAVEIFTDSKQGEFNCILMDVLMPVMNGIEATLLIRKMERPDAETVPIIALSANAFAEDVQKAKEAGVNDYLTKPINMEQLFKTIETACRILPKEKE